MKNNPVFHCGWAHARYGHLFLLLVLLVLGLVLVSCATPERVQTPALSSSAAVILLAENARQSRSNKQYDRAAAQLERALRIEPDNPGLWYELAYTSLEKGQSSEAIQFATKSNALTRDPRLRSRNWRLIEQAYSAQGDRDRARQVRREADAEP